MRTRLTITFMLSLFTVASLAQRLENDDMYFNSKDRAKVKAQQPKEITYASVKTKKANELSAKENPTDTYSARNVNPEYAARSNAQSAQSDNEDYFVNNYRYNTANDLNNWNNNFNNWYSSPWYRPNYFAPSIYGWNSPYYGFNSPYYSPWYDPYWNYNGWSASFSYYWGSSWNYGWGGNYNYWNRPYCGYASSWGPSWGWGSGWYGYPRTVVVVNNYEGGRNVTYGKRPSRSTVMANDYNGSRSRSSYISTNTSGRDNSGGRVNNEYYNRSWRYSSSTGNTNNDNRSRYLSNSYNNNNNSNSNRSNSSYNSNNSFNSGRSFSTPGNSNSGTTRTYSPSSGSGTNGRTRGN